VPHIWLGRDVGTGDGLIAFGALDRREVLGRAAVGGERERLRQGWRELDQKLDGYAARRPRETAVVVLEPRENRLRAGGVAQLVRAVDS
jgi:hypothetical protein